MAAPTHAHNGIHIRKVALAADVEVLEGSVVEQRTQHGLSRARRPDKHEPLGQLASQRCELVGVPEVVHHFLQLRLQQRINMSS